jgi:hypothetical protein
MLTEPNPGPEMLFTDWILPALAVSGRQRKVAVSDKASSLTERLARRKAPQKMIDRTDVFMGVFARYRRADCLVPKRARELAQL